MSAIAKLWAKEIIAGRRTLDEVPAKLKSEVEEILKAEGYEWM